MVQVLTQTSVAFEGGGGGGTPYTDQQVIDILCAKQGYIVYSFRVNILYRGALGWIYKGDLTPWVSRIQTSGDAQIGQSQQAVIRKLSMSILETAASELVDISGAHVSTAPINFYYDMVQPVYRLMAPDGGWLEWSLGLYQFTNPEALLSGYAVEADLQLADIVAQIQQVQAVSQEMLGAYGSLGSGSPINAAQSVAATPVIINSGLNMGQVVWQLLTNGPWDTNIPGCLIPPEWIDSNIIDSGGVKDPASGSGYKDAVIPGEGYTMQPGTSLLDIINQFLYYLNCDPLWATCGVPCPVNGSLTFGQTQYTPNGTVSYGGPILTTRRWPAGLNYNNPADTAHTPVWYFTTEHGTALTRNILAAGGGLESATFSYSNVLPGTTDATDLSQAANVVQLIFSDPSGVMSVVSAVNANLNSPISLVNMGRPIVRTISDNGIPAGTSLANWAQNIAEYELVLASSAIENVTLASMVIPIFDPLDVIGLNIYTDYISDGQQQHTPLISSEFMAYNDTTAGHVLIPGLASTERFVVTGYTITLAQNAINSVSPPAQQGITPGLDSRQQTMGAYMTVNCQRVSSITPDGTTVNFSAVE